MVEVEGALEEVEETGGEMTAGKGTASKLRRPDCIETDCLLILPAVMK